MPIWPGMIVFEGDPPVHIERKLSIADGGVCNVSVLDIGAHTGTHIDSPLHFIDGAPGTDSIPLDALMGPALVVDATGQQGTITAADVAAWALPAGETRLLLKTPNSRRLDEAAFDRTFQALDVSAAAALVARGTRLIANDYLSIAPFDDPKDTHVTLLRAGVVILEGVDLRGVEPGRYELLCLPIRLVDCDGAPCRALLRPRT